MLASITLKFWDTIEKYLRYDASCPKVFCSTIQNHQQVNSSAICALFRAFKKIRLTDKLGQDVETFGNKMDEISRWFIGIGSAPIYLSTLIFIAFIDC